MTVFIKKHPFISAIMLAGLLVLATFVAAFINPGILFIEAGVRAGLCTVLVFFLYRWGLRGVLPFRLSTFMRGLLIGMPIFLFALWIAHNNAFGFPGIFQRPIESNISINAAFWDLCARVLMIGILEELTFRGLVLNTYLKHNGVTRGTIYKAVLSMIEPTIILLIGIFILRNIHKEKYMGVISKAINGEEEVRGRF